MNCEDCRAWIEEYVDGEVDEQDRSLMDSHLSACISCCAAYEELVAEEQFLIDNYQPEISVSAGAWANVRAGYREAPSALPPKLLGRLRGALLTVSSFASPQPALKIASMCILLACGVYLASRIASSPSRNAPEMASEEGAGIAATRQGSPGEAPPANSGRANGHEQQNSAAADIQRSSAPTTPRAMQDAAAMASSSSGVGYSRRASSQTVGRPKAGDHLRSGPEVLIARANDGGEATVVASPQRDVTAEAGEPLSTTNSSVNLQAARHLEKVQLVLRSFSNQSAAEGDDELDVSYVNQLSKRLLSANNTLRQEMKDKGDLRSEVVLNNLDPFLADIAALPDRVSRIEARGIEERLRREGVVSALPVFASTSLARGSRISNR